MMVLQNISIVWFHIFCVHLSFVYFNAFPFPASGSNDLDDEELLNTSNHGWKGDEDDLTQAHFLTEEILKAKSMEHVKQRAKQRSGQESPIRGRGVTSDTEDETERDFFSDIPEPEDNFDSDYRRLIITDSSLEIPEEQIMACQMLKQCLELRKVLIRLMEIEIHTLHT